MGADWRQPLERLPSTGVDRRYHKERTQTASTRQGTGIIITVRPIMATVPSA